MQNLDMRTHILETASRLFSAKGYAAVSMRDVAKAIGVNITNLYYHFSNKEQLIRACLRICYY